MSEIRFAIPKGSLEDATFKLLEKSWTKVTRKSRTYRVYLDDPNIIVKMLPSTRDSNFGCRRIV